MKLYKTSQMISTRRFLEFMQFPRFRNSQGVWEIIGFSSLPVSGFRSQVSGRYSCVSHLQPVTRDQQPAAINPKSAIDLTVLLFISYYGMKNTTDAGSMPSAAVNLWK